MPNLHYPIDYCQGCDRLRIDCTCGITPGQEDDDIEGINEGLEDLDDDNTSQGTYIKE